MAIPIIEQIAVELAARIDEITTANGFQQNLTALRPKRDDFADVTPADGVVLMVQEDAEADPESPWPMQDWQQVFLLCAIVLDADDAATSIDVRKNQVAADIAKKLRADRSRGGLANETTILGRTNFAEGAFTGIAVAVMVDYRHQADDPYTQ